MEQNTMLEHLQDICEQFYGERLKAEDLQRLLSISQIRVFPKGEIIQGIQQKLTHSGLILSGMVRSYYLDMEGNEITRNFHKEGYLVIEEGLLGYEYSLGASEALEDTTILLMDTEKLKRLVKERESLKNIYIACLEWGIRYKIYRESEFLTKNATDRYLQFCEDYPELVNRVKQSYISTYLGITPESLSRIRRTLKEN